MQDQLFCWQEQKPLLVVIPYDALFNGKKAPSTYLRLDRAHTLKSLLDMLSSLDRNKKRFYSRILGFLLLNENINEAKVLIENMFIVLLNRYQFNETVKKSISFLREITDTHHISIENILIMEENDKHTTKFDRLQADKNIHSKKDKSKFFHWIQSIKMYSVNVELNDSLENPPCDISENPFYAYNMEADLQAFFAKIHMWSNVMIDSFGSTNKTPTSACSESHFNVLKNVLFSHEKKVRVDVFVRRYIDHLNGCAIQAIVKKDTDNFTISHEADSDSKSRKPVLKLNSNTHSAKDDQRDLHSIDNNEISDKETKYTKCAERSR